MRTRQLFSRGNPPELSQKKSRWRMGSDPFLPRKRTKKTEMGALARRHATRPTKKHPADNFVPIRPNSRHCRNPTPAPKRQREFKWEPMVRVSGVAMPRGDTMSKAQMSPHGKWGPKSTVTHSAKFSTLEKPISDPKYRRKSKWRPVAKVSGTGGHAMSKVKWPTAADDDLQIGGCRASQQAPTQPIPSSHSPSQRRSSAQSVDGQNPRVGHWAHCRHGRSSDGRRCKTGQPRCRARSSRPIVEPLGVHLVRTLGTAATTTARRDPWPAFEACEGWARRCFAPSP
jgi:hypothetical protein